jgi:predicted DCC family thiol-disulfide oxidoreductase YuxK
MTSSIVALYDGQCVICNTSRRLFEAIDKRGRIEWLDVHRRDEVARRYPDFVHDEMMGEIHVVADGGTLYRGFRGSRRLFRAVPLGWPLWALLRLPVIGNWVGPWVYRQIARHRYTINRWVGAPVSQPSLDCDDGVCKVK